MATGSLYGSVSESTGLYGIGAASGGTYFEWFIFYDSATAPATPTGGSWSFTTNTGTAPSGWLNAPPASPTNLVWVSIAVVDSRSTSTLTWSAPGLMTGSGLPILTGSGVPSSGTGLNGQLYVNTATTPQSMYLKEAGSWVQITGSNLVDLVNNQTIGGVKTFSSTIVGNISGTASNVSGTVAIANGGTGGTTASGARTNLGLGTIATQDASNVSITGGSITGITDLAVADGGTGASTAANARTNLGAVGLTDVQTLTNKTISGASNTLTNIGNSSLSNSTVTVNGSSIALGSSATVTASTPNNLVFGSQLSANASFNGSQQVNVNLLAVSTPGTYGTSNVVPVFTLNSYGQITSVSPQTITIDTTDISGTIGIGQGGTGANTVTAARVNLLPSYTGNGGKLLALNAGATDLEWKAVSGIGTVTSVDVSGGTTGLTTYGGPITAAGTVTLAGTLNVANGGTGATSAANALTNLGAIGAITSTDGSVTIGTTGTTRDLSVAVSASTNNVICQVRNTTGATLTKGTAVYISGATGQIPTISKALATSDATSSQTLGLLTADLANNSNGNVTIIGLLTNMDTSAYTDGAQLYLSGTTAGTLTATKQYAPIHLVYVAVVEYSHPTQGKLFVKVQNGYELDEIHNVSAQSPTTGQTIVYNSSTSLWEKNTVSLTAGVNGTLPVANGGTGLTSFTANGVVYASSTSALATGTALTFDGTTLGLPRIGQSSSGNYGFFNTTGAGNGFLSFQYNSSEIGELGQGSGIISGGSNTDFGIRATNNLLFAISYNEQMRLTSTGLGIGTSSPSEKLEVYGSTVGGVVAKINNANASGYSQIYLTNSGASGRSYVLASGGNSAASGFANNFYIYDTAAAATRLTLDSSGNLGLGVTPSAWDSTYYKAFQFGNNGASLSAWTSSLSSNKIAHLTNNGYQTYTGGVGPIWRYTTDGTSALYKLASNQHEWHTAPSGTAGNAITFTQALTLDSSGNLLVGTSAFANSNTNSAILQASGGTCAFIIQHDTGNVSGNAYEVFNYNGSAIGSITQSGTTAVLYNITSDQRLKENIIDAPEFGSVIDSIKVRSYDWKADGNHQRAGFVAQELVTVAPEAVHQPADPEEMMAVDYSKLVPMLVKEIQSLRKRLADAGIA